LTSKYKKALFLFRKDLRLKDNTGLINASKASEIVVPAFIFDPRLARSNSYFSHNAFQFMTESIRDLAQQVASERGSLCIFEGRPEAVVENLIVDQDLGAVFVNGDYTPFSRARDAAIEKLCKEKEVAFHASSDALLHEPGDVLKEDGKPTIFSHFLKKKRGPFLFDQSTAQE
jgi:deoxyribodipyrimidine photo-lyase